MKALQIALVLAGAAGLLSACTSTDLPDIQPGQRPALETDEAGLWMMMDKAEDDLRTSGRVVTDTALNTYVRGVLCKVAGDYCDDIKLYIVTVPNFNASMAPNGVMQVWTGALLRVQNEAQLAFLLGHELGHYQRRHSLKNWRDTRAKLDFLPFFRVAAALGGVGFVGDIASIAVIGSIFSYSRDHEREADDAGFDVLVAAGYDPREAANVWRVLKTEMDAGDQPKRSVFFATHPGIDERLQTLAEKAAATDFKADEVTLGVAPYREVTTAYRQRWLRDELRKRNFDQTLAVLDQIEKSDEGMGLTAFFRGEVYRLRDEDGNLELAEAAYRDAIDSGGEPPETYRSLGLVVWKQDRPAEARAAFAEYLRRDPEAEDRAVIETYLTELGGTLS